MICSVIKDFFAVCSKLLYWGTEICIIVSSFEIYFHLCFVKCQLVLNVQDLKLSLQIMNGGL